MWMENVETYIIYEDKELLVCHKPSGVPVQSAGIGTMDLESALKNYIAKKEKGDSLPYLAVINRLDQPVEGLVLFAKKPSAARKLSQELTAGKINKYYLAVTFHKPEKQNGTLENYLKKDGRSNTSAVVLPGAPGAKMAKLSYRWLDTAADPGSGREKYLLMIHLDTGRHHQIRVQMANAGMPLAGDRKYNPGERDAAVLGLCSFGLEFTHPAKRKRMKFQEEPKGEVFLGFPKREYNL